MVQLVWTMCLLCRDEIGFDDRTVLHLGGGNGASSYRHCYPWQRISLDDEI